MTPADLFAYLRTHPVVRRVAWLGFLSLIAAVTLSGYVFGLSDGFFGRMLSTTLVLWLLTVGTALGIRPLVRWLTNRLAGRAPAPRSRRATPPRRATAPRIPASKWR